MERLTVSFVTLWSAPSQVPPSFGGDAGPRGASCGVLSCSPQYWPGLDKMNPGTVERAFEIAQSGQAVGVAEVRAILAREGYTDGLAHTASRELSGRLTATCQLARREKGYSA